MIALSAIGWVDLLLGGILVLSVLVGIWRGLVFELMSLVGWVVAYIAAQAFSPQLGAHLPIGSQGSAMHQAVAFALTFIAALVIWVLLAKLVRMAVHATPLTVVDRLLGGAFGLLRGVVVLLATATLLAFTPAVRSAPWQQSHGASWLGTLLQGLKPVLPAELSRHLPA